VLDFLSTRSISISISISKYKLKYKNLSMVEKKSDLRVLYPSPSLTYVASQRRQQILISLLPTAASSLCFVPETEIVRC